MDIREAIITKAIEGVQALYNQKINNSLIHIEKTKPEFTGDYTLVVFPLSRFSKKSPPETAKELGGFLVNKLVDLKSFDVINGFLNLTIAQSYWLEFFKNNIQNSDYGILPQVESKPVVLEYSSPNTNKPLHLGHIRNNLLGSSIANILKANGINVVKINLVNDRGIHICKSMLAWQKWGNGETPKSGGLKGDHLIGKYYVLFDKKHKEQIEELVHRGFTDDNAFDQAPIMKEAQEMLRLWEEADEDTLMIWRMMNEWVYEGFEKTYDRLGVSFDKTNYESVTYLQGKEIVEEGVNKGVFQKRDDGSIWVDLQDEGLDEKLLLRSDGTSVYITQDLGTAQRRHDEYNPINLLYVVGNEQIYHFDVLKKVLKRLDRKWWDTIQHLSYGMVELPEGRMKSREGTVVDADDLMDEMFETAKKTTEELGKTREFSEKEKKQLFHIVSLGALKYFILKVDPKKNMLFNPEESIDFNGNTGPFIQYTYARIQSIFRKAEKKPDEFIHEMDLTKADLLDIEKDIIMQIYEYPEIVKQAGENYSPAIIANYCFELVKTYNRYYQEHPILKRIDKETANFRVSLSWFTGNIIKKAVALLGIDVPERM